jgi:hypothetical protein
MEESMSNIKELYYKFAIGAIFKDEFEYILEWLAWHLDCGIKHFYIADNGSTDGSAELLEALSLLGIITLIYQEQKKEAQLEAYRKIIGLASNDDYELLFLDADEFLYSSTAESPAAILSSLLDKNSDVGAIALNWRLFGSSGKKNKSADFVTRRFTQYASYDMPQTKFIKSLVRPHAVTDMQVHQAVLKPGYKYLNVLGNVPLFQNRLGESSSSASGKTMACVDAPLCINHYIVKSKQEYIEKKKTRGDAMVGPNHDRGEAYFIAHDRNDLELSITHLDFDSIQNRVDKINMDLVSKTNYMQNAIGVIDVCNREILSGWFRVQNSNTPSASRLAVFVNGKFVDTVLACDLRVDLREKFQSDGLNGFRYNFNPMLNKNDMVFVKPVGNKSPFRNNNITIYA